MTETPLPPLSSRDERRKIRNPLGGLVDHNLTYGRHVVREFLRAAAPFNTVADLGAGTGQDLRIAREVQVNARLVALEAYPAFVTGLEGIADEVYAVDIEHDQFPLDDESVDVVIANQVLEHTKELFWIFHEMTRSLRVGGTAVIGVPNLAAFHNRVMLTLGKQPTCIKTASAHVRGFTRADLIRFVDLCFPAGFTCVGHRGSQFYPFRGSTALAAAKLAPGLAGSLFVALRKERGYVNEFLTFPPAFDLETNFYVGQS